VHPATLHGVGVITKPHLPICGIEGINDLKLDPARPGFIHAAAAVENQRVGKTRRRSIYSADTQTRLTNREPK